jgi:hypothetical protein
MDEPTPLERHTRSGELLTFADSRASVLVLPTCAAVLVGFALLVNPSDTLWHWLFEPLRMYRWWPLMPLALSVWFIRAGFADHARNGHALSFPWLSAVFTSLVLAPTLAFLCIWAADGSLAWGRAVKVVGASSAVMLAGALVLYGEWWRSGFMNDLTVGIVGFKIRRGSFDAKCSILELVRRVLLAPRRWASPHALHIFDAEYHGSMLALERALLDAGNRWRKSAEVRERLRTAARMGYALHDYLELPRAFGLTPYWETLRVELTRELFILDHWHAELELEPGASPGRPIEAADFEQLGGSLPTEYTAFVRRLMGAAPIDAAQRCSLLAGAVADYASIGEGSLTLRDVPRPLRDLAMQTWWALASGLLSSTQVLDGFLAMGGSLQEAPRGVVDPFRVLAMLLKAEGYDALAARVTVASAPSFSTGLEEKRGDALRAVAKHAPGWSRQAHVAEVSSHQTSFIYDAACPVFLPIVAATASLLFIPSHFLLRDAMPALSNHGGNVIDHLIDPRTRPGAPFTGYADVEIHAFAANGHTLAVTRPGGVTFVDTLSRVPYELDLGSPKLPATDDGQANQKQEQTLPLVVPLDITRSQHVAEFLVLEADQGVRSVTGNPRQRGAPSRWLEPPPQPSWPGTGPIDAGDVLATRVDRKGWLLAVRDRGIARYQFRSDPEYGLLRTRSFQLSSLSNLPLVAAAVTDAGVWYSAGDRVGRADFERLEDSGESVLHARVDARLDVGPAGTWATAIDANGGLYLFGSNRWSSPFFSTVDSGLKSAADVKLLLHTEPVTWLTDTTALYVYDHEQRALRKVAPFAGATELEMVSGKVPGVVLAGQGGLGFAERSAPGAVSIRPLEDARVTSLGVTPDGQLLVYAREIEQRKEVFAMPAPYGRRVQLAGSRGWVGHKPPERVTGVRVVGDLALFATSQGAFYYDGLSRQYRDQSLLDRTLKPLVQFDSLVEEPEGGVVAIADHRAVGLCSGASAWHELLGTSSAPVRQLAVAQTGVVGLGLHGELRQYGSSPCARPFARAQRVACHDGVSLDDCLALAGAEPLVSAIRRAFLGHESEPSAVPAAVASEYSAGFRGTPPRANTLQGDVLRRGSGFQLVLAHAGTVARYDSSTGNLADQGAQTHPQDVKQARLDENGALYYLSHDARVLDASGRVVFGGRSAPFSPEQATALGAWGSSVVLADGAGRIVGYDWSTGAWAPLGNVHGRVSRVESTHSGLIATAGDTSYVVKDGLATPIGRRVVSMDAGLYVLTDKGVSFELQGVAYPRSITADMRRFTEASSFAWQSGKDGFFLGRNGMLGKYDADHDVFEQTRIASSLEQVQDFDGGVVALADSSVLEISREGVTSRWFEGVVAEGRKSLRAVGAELRLAYANGTELSRHALTRGKPLVTQEWGSVLRDDFDFQNVVFAQREGDALYFVDRHARCTRYTPRARRWEMIRRADPGDSVFGYRGASQEHGAEIYFAPADADRLPSSLPFLDGTCAVHPSFVPYPPNYVQRLEVPPGVGTLPKEFGASDGDFRLSARDGVLSYELRVGSAWLPLHLADGPPSRRDAFIDAKLDKNGVLWVLTPVTLERLAASDRLEALRATHGERTLDEVLSESEQAEHGFSWEQTGEALVSLELPGRKVVFGRSPGARLTARLSDGSDQPLWGSCGGLATQCIRDLARGRDGTLLLASEAGVLVRDSRTYMARQLDTRHRRAEFTLPVDGDRVFLSEADGVREWLGAVASSEIYSGPLLTRASSGPWEFSLDLRVPGVSVRAVPEGLPVTGRWWGGGQWRFDADTVDWIYRDGPGLALLTADGTWQFDGQGRTQRRQGPTPEDQVRAENPALRASYAHGMVTLTPADGPDTPAIVDGRLFFDNTSEIAATERPSMLFSLVPGRGVVHRDPARLAEIRAFLPLPADLKGASLRTLGELARLEVTGLTEGKAPCREITRTNEWSACPTPTPPRQVSVNGVIWREQPRPSAGFLPLVGVTRDGTGGTADGARIDKWWTQDRFSWDLVHAVEALGPDAVVTTTDAGIVVSALASRGLRPVAWAPELRPRFADKARESGRVIGVLTWGGAVPNLVHRDGNAWRFDAAAQVEREHAELVFDWSQPNAPHELVARLAWTTRQSGPLLHANLGIDIGELIQRGQFVFDTARAAAPLSAGEDGRWWTANHCSNPERDTCLVTENQLVGRRLALRALQKAPCVPGSVRLRNAKQGLAVCESHPPTGDEAQQREVYQFPTEGGSWERRLLADVTADFAAGARVEFDGRQLTWRVAGVKTSWQPDALSIKPNYYPLFTSKKCVETEEVSLSFDVLTALSFDPKTQRVALGSRGGVMTVGGPAEYLRARINETPSKSAAPRIVFDRVGPVGRLLRGSSGALWSQDDSRFAQVDSSGVRRLEDARPADLTQVLDLDVHLDQTGFARGRTEWRQSTDVWERSHSLVDIVGFDVDESSHSLWIATRRNGIFKVFSEHLGSVPSN